MNASEAVDDVYRGKLVECSGKEYRDEIRRALQDQAGKWIDEGQDPYAWVALQEVKRLDKLHGFQMI